jgi:hypothetical protein
MVCRRPSPCAHRQALSFDARRRGAPARALRRAVPSIRRRHYGKRSTPCPCPDLQQTHKLKVLSPNPTRDTLGTLAAFADTQREDLSPTRANRSRGRDAKPPGQGNTTPDGRATEERRAQFLDSRGVFRQRRPLIGRRHLASRRGCPAAAAGVPERHDLPVDRALPTRHRYDVDAASRRY